jgi:hypothetical protein
MARPKRPASIIRFERLFYLGLGVAALNAMAVATDPAAQAGPDPMEPSFIFFFLAVTTAINLLFLWLIAYRGSSIARWIFIGLIVLTMLALVADLPHALDFGALSLALSLIQNLLCAIQVVLLVRRDSRDWFAGVRPVDPQIFR